MKNYPDSLADITVFGEVIRYLYEQAETCDDAAESNRRYIKENELEAGSWTHDSLLENVAKAAAYRRLADKLSKR